MMALLRRQVSHTLLILGSFRGNARGCLLTEPLWGIPYNLYIAYTPLYMLALGCSERQIGGIASIGLLFQMIFSLASGYITDRLGRLRTTLIFDLISWSIPTLIWAFARNYYFFLAAAVINSIVRIVHTSWSCLLIEDTPRRKRVHVYTWIRVAGTLAGFFAPIAGLFVERFGLVRSVRGLYLFAFVCMTSMFLLRNHLTTETVIGRRKMEETRGVPFRNTLVEYRDILRELWGNPLTIAAFFISLMGYVQLVIRQNFLSILLRKGLDIPLSTIAVVPAVTSVVSLLVYVLFMPSWGRMKPERALAYSITATLAGFAVIASAPRGSILLMVVGVVLETFGTSTFFPFSEALLANVIPDEHRAKVLSIVHTLIFGLMAPFGLIGGMLSAASPRLPFVLVIGTLLIRYLLLLVLRRFERTAKAVPAPHGTKKGT